MRDAHDATVGSERGEDSFELLGLIRLSLPITPRPRVTKSSSVEIENFVKEVSFKIMDSQFRCISSINFWTMDSIKERFEDVKMSFGSSIMISFKGQEKSVSDRQVSSDLVFNLLSSGGWVSSFVFGKHVGRVKLMVDVECFAKIASVSDEPDRISENPFHGAVKG